MFSLSVIEHLRLNSDLVIQNYTVHAKAAERLAAAALKTRMAILGLLALAATAIALSFFRPTPEYHIIAAVLAGLAFAVEAAVIGYGIEARVHAHRLLAHRLWLLCERYRELLTEIQDGLVDTAGILRRREALTEQVHAVYEQGFAVDQQAYESVRLLPFATGGEAKGEPQIQHEGPTLKAG
jgi:hypothetical protein